MFMKKNEFIKKVIDISVKNVKNGGGPFGALIVKNDKIVSYGINDVTLKNDPTAHAEINAIRKAAKKLKTFDLKDCIIFSSCEPCPMCFSAIYWANIKKVYYLATRKEAAKYGFKDEKIYKELKNKIVSIKMEKVENKDKELPFKLWNSQKNKIQY